jgi:uncharacterized membrane protein YphA (DoxX/SURF4 family)
VRFRDQVALTLPALLLRLTLCLIFLWAGLGKIVGEMTVTGSDAARLVAMGVNLTPAPAQAPTAEPNRTRPDTGPIDPAPVDPRPIMAPDQTDSQTNSQTNSRTNSQPARPTVLPTEPPSELFVPDPLAAATAAAPAARWLPVQMSTIPFTAADFPNDYPVQRVFGIALLLSKAADPGLSANSEPIPPTMPAWVGADRWPLIFAWAAAATELLAAALLLFGVLTRFGAILIVGIMLQAMWLTQIGPAFVGQRQSYLGFIPAGADPWAPGTYQTLFFQLSCLVMAAAIFLLGSGPIGFDRALFRAPERLERNTANPKRRSTFDRQPTDTP